MFSHCTKIKLPQHKMTVKKAKERNNVNSEIFKSLNINAEAVKCLFPHMVTTIVCVDG